MANVKDYKSEYKDLYLSENKNLIMNKKDLLSNLDKIHTTESGIGRIRRNLCLDIDDVVGWCKEKVKNKNSSIVRRGKNWYIRADYCEITINAHSYTIITAHKVKNIIN